MFCFQNIHLIVAVSSHTGELPSNDVNLSQNAAQLPYIIGGVIVGMIIFFLILILVIITVVCILRRRRRVVKFKGSIYTVSLTT